MARAVMGKDAHVAFGGCLAAYGGEWSFTLEGDSLQEGVMGGSGKKKAWVGQQQLNGSVVMKIDRDSPPEVKNPVSDTQITLTLYDDYATDPGSFWTVPAKIVSMAETMSARTGLPGEVTVNWQSDGDWIAPTRN